jgi:hypothetical protein
LAAAPNDPLRAIARKTRTSLQSMLCPLTKMNSESAAMAVP